MDAADIHQAFISLLRDLLAIAAQNVDNGLSGVPTRRRRFPRAGTGIAKHYGTRE